MHFRVVVLVLMLVSVAGCQSPQIEAAFVADDHAFAGRKGAATISGQAFMRRRDGLVVYAAGRTILLMPDTPYTREVLKKRAGPLASYTRPKIDHAYNSYLKETLADAEGRFTFSGVGPGNYLVFTAIYWEEDGTERGGFLLKPVTVGDGGTIDVIVTK